MRMKWVGGGLVAALVLVLGFLALHGDLSESPTVTATNRAARTETRPPRPRAQRPAAVAAPAGGVLVLGADGRPADEGAVMTSATDGPLSSGAWRQIAVVPAGGVVAAESFTSPPRAFVRAVGGRFRSPAAAWDPSGVVLLLAEGCVIEGVVIDGGERPVAGAWVASADKRAIATTDLEGRFRLSGFDEGEEVEVRAAVARDAQGSARLTFAPGETRREVRIVIPTVPPGGLVADIRFAAERTTRATLAVAPATTSDLPQRAAPSEERRMQLPDGRNVLVRIPSTALAADAEHELRVICRGFRTTKARRAIPQDRVETVRIDVPEGGVAPTGVVLDAAGDPVAGAEIHGQQDDGGFAGRVVARTEADGSFPVPGARVRWIAAVTPGRGASPWVRIDDAEGEVVLRLGAGGAVRGTVRKRDSGDAAAGVPVTLRIGAWPGTDWAATTDAGGAFTFPAVPQDVPLYLHVRRAGRWSGIQVEQEQFPTRRDDRPASTVAWHPGLRAAGEVWTRDLTVDEWPGVEVTFPFRVAGGGPVPRSLTIEVSSSFANGSERTTLEIDLDPADPSFRRYLRAGVHRVHFRGPGVNPASEDLDVAGDGPPRTVPVELRPAGKARVLVRVVRADGAPLGPGTKLLLAHKRGGNSSGLGDFDVPERGSVDVTDAVRRAPSEAGVELRGTVSGPGLFRHDRFSPIPDLRVALADVAERLAAHPDDDVVVDASARTHLELELRAGAGGSPAAGVVLDAEPAERFGAASYTTGADGRVVVRLLGIEPGRRGERPVLKARAPYAGTWEWEAFWNPSSFGAHLEGDRWVADLELQGLRSVRCTLVDPAGRPVGGARMEDPRDGTPAVTTDAAGRFTVTTTNAPDDVRVYFEGWYVERAADDAGAEEPRFVAVRERDVAVTVRGAPADAERVTVRASAPGMSWGARVDARGEGPERRVRAFRALALPIDLVAETPDHRWRATARVAADATSAELTLSRVADVVVEFRIAYPDGSPLAGRKVALDLSGSTTPATTDAAGVARFTVPAGEAASAKLTADGLGFTALPRPFAAPQSAAVPVTVETLIELDLHRKLGAPVAPLPRIDATALVRADGVRVGSMWRGSFTAPGREVHRFALAGPGSGTFEVRIGDRTWPLPFDAEHPKTLTIVLD